jgi:hypothetical protein
MSDDVHEISTDYMNLTVLENVQDKQEKIKNQVSQQIQQTNKKHKYRPISYSDNTIFLTKNSVIPVFEYHPIQTQHSINQQTHLQIHSSENEIEKYNCCASSNLASDIWKRRIHCFTDTGLRFLFHIILLSIFETVFFFKIVSRYESKGILDIVNTYIQNIANNCVYIPDSDKSFINGILSVFINATQIELNGHSAYATRMAHNMSIYVNSWAYVIGISTFFVLISAIPYILKFKLHWKLIILDNIGLIFFLGIYEYLFFKNIILPYTVVSLPEIDLSVLSTIQGTCGLLT